MYSSQQLNLSIKTLGLAVTVHTSVEGRGRGSRSLGAPVQRQTQPDSGSATHFRLGKYRVKEYYNEYKLAYSQRTDLCQICM